MDRPGANGKSTRRSFIQLGPAMAAAFVPGRSTVRAQGLEAEQITSPELAARLAKKDFFLVNVHIPYEGEIEQTDAFIAYDTIAASLDKLPRDRNARIVVYCMSGRMSATAAKDLASLGFTQVSDLMGGMIGWQESGYKIIKK